MNDTRTNTVADAAWFEDQRSRYAQQLRDDQNDLRRELELDDFNERNADQEEDE
jgi:hypothetical protein